MKLRASMGARRDRARLKREAKTRARQAFALKYPERKAAYVCEPEESRLDGSRVVVVCWDWGGIPPGRTWWRVLPGGGEATELSIEEARSHVEIAPLR